MFFIKHRTLFFKQKQNPQILSTMLSANKSNLQQIYNHPFNLQLFKGTLSPATFGCYLRDDYFYLHQFSSVLQQLSKQTIKVNPYLADHLDYLAKDIINNELNMQRRYKEHLEHMSDYIPSNAIFSYAEYLSKTIRDSELPVGLSAVLPCFWIYHQLGIIHLYSANLDSNPYKEWITTYSSREFITATQDLAKTITTQAEQSKPEIQLKMKKAFKIAVQFELDFFDEVCSQDNEIKCGI